MKLFVPLLLAILICSCKGETNGFIIDDDYRTKFNILRQDRMENRINYLQLTGLFALDSLDNTLGKDPSNTFSLNIESLPETIGTISVYKDSIIFQANDGVEVKTSTDSLITRTPIRLNAYKSSEKLFHDRLNWQIITRVGKLYLRVWDSENPMVDKFKGYETFDLNPDFIFNADFIYYETKKEEAVNSELGVMTNTNFIGYARFDYNGKSHQLDVGQNGFTMVHDLTSGDATYGGGRYIYLDLPKTDSLVTLDFNRLYNPPCAFSKFTTCLYPPPQNQLPFKIEAGENLVLK
jgi:uncharacterized protein (DUF1684 family)